MDRTITDRSFPDLKKRRYRIKLSKHIKSEIRGHARAEAPRECCGFILGNGETYRTKNTATEDNRFRVSTEDYVAADRLDTIKAVYHSHPKSEEPSFSEFDKFNSISHDVIYVLFSLKDNSFTQFDPSLSNFNKYIGRSFEIGKTDCFALIKDFYEFELGVSLKDYHRDESYSSHLPELFDKHFEEEGFNKREDLQKYDCILLRKREGDPSNHIALYLGKGLILHQPEKSYSRIEEYTSTHKKLTNHIIRHEKVN